MTIDERLDRLTERHEALAESLEILTADMHEMQAEQKQRNVRIDSLHADMMLAIARLANAGEANNGKLDEHERRLDKLEGK